MTQTYDQIVDVIACYYNDNYEAVMKENIRLFGANGRLIEKFDEKMTPALKYLVNEGTIYFKIEASTAHKNYNIKLCKHDSYDL